MRVRSALTWLVLVVAAVLAGPRVVDALPGGGAGDGEVVALDRVVDGDTIRVLRRGESESVRYIGVDTPETYGGVECHGRAAKRANARLVDGTRLRLTFDAERRDRYGRLLAYVRRADDGRLVNEELLRLGAARTLTIAPNDAHAARFARAERAARAARRGLWSACG